jgi:hypothetical protein
MNATRIRYAVSRALLTLLTLACACTACSAPAPPAGDADRTVAEPAPAPGAPSADAPVADTPAAAMPDAKEPEADSPPAVSPEPAAPPAPIDSPPSSPKPTLPIIKAPAKPMPPQTSPSADDQTVTPVHITINALSRGKGVPAGTRDAFKQIRALLERQQATAAVVAVRYQRIGLEGESRLCVEFRNASDAQAALTEIRKIAAGADLLNVVEAPCPSNKE